ncbi:MAG: AraC family transcriptional regulator [Clostridia bacterium]
MLNISEANIKFQLDNLKIKVVHINYGVFYKPFPRHRHGNRFYEAHLVTGGSGTLIANGVHYPLKGGTLYMTGPLIEHEQITDFSDPMDEYCIQFEITETKGKVRGKTATFLKETVFWIGEDSQNMKRIFEMLTEESENKRIGYIQSVINLSFQIMISLSRNYAGMEQVGEYSAITPDDKRMIIADEIFLYNYSTVTLKELSERLNLSPRQTQRFLKKAYGKTFIQLRTEARGRRAKELLNEGVPLSKAAELVGYESESSLNFIKK